MANLTDVPPKSIPIIFLDILYSFVPILLTLVYQNVKRVSIVFQKFSQFHLQKKNLSAKTQTDFFTLRYEVLKRVSRIERQL